MLNFIEKNNLASLFIVIVMLTFLRIPIPFESGYSGSDSFVILIYTELLRYLLMGVFVFVAIDSKLKRNQIMKCGSGLVILFMFGLIPTDHLMTLGALCSIQTDNPTQIREDARKLMDEYEPYTHFGDHNLLARYPFNNPIPKDQLPLTLQSSHVNDVYVLRDYVFLEKFGLSGLFRGFVVFRENADIWKNDKPVMLLDGCSYCWRIRILEGLYWYHAVPIKEEKATVFSPLE